MRILIVDDDYVSRVKLSALLSAHDHCECAPNGEIAIKLFEAAHEESVPYNLVTLDIEMPGMSGPQVVTGFREMEQAWKSPGESTAKIIMVTAKRTAKDVVSSYHEGCDGYLIKPINREKLEQALIEVGLR
jgi:two-component system, chemotaxis family, chemotaxis protein CheY